MRCKTITFLGVFLGALCLGSNAGYGYRLKYIYPYAYADRYLFLDNDCGDHYSPYPYYLSRSGYYRAHHYPVYPYPYLPNNINIQLQLSSNRADGSDPNEAVYQQENSQKPRSQRDLYRGQNHPRRRTYRNSRQNRSYRYGGYPY